MKLRPLQDRILVQRVKEEDKTKLKPVACVLSRASLPDFSYSASAGCWSCKVIA